jgi:hypothetical protein
MRRNTGQLQGLAQVKVHCLAAVFLIIAVVHSVLAAVDQVTWPVVSAAACVVGATVLERILLVQERPAGTWRRDAAQHILREGLGELPRFQFDSRTDAGRP